MKKSISHISNLEHQNIRKVTLNLNIAYVIKELKKELLKRKYKSYNDTLFINDPFYVVLTEKYCAVYKKQSPTIKLNITTLDQLSNAQVERQIQPLFLQYADRLDRIEEIQYYIIQKIR